MRDGAEEGNNLEPFSASEILAELESWSQIIAAEPEVIHSFETLGQDVPEGTDKDAAEATQPTGPASCAPKGLEL